MDKHDPSDRIFSREEQAVLTAKSRRLIQDAIDLKQELIASHLDVIVQMAEAMFQTLNQGGKVLLCGNGGSAADAQHLAAELLVRLRSNINRNALPALALATDTSSLTAHGNDYGFDSYFARMTRALGNSQDMLVGISTSGKSPNVIQALRVARAKGMRTLGFLGGDGGEALAECDLALVVPSTITGRIQECHICVGHVIIELAEDRLLASGFLSRESSTI